MCYFSLKIVLNHHFTHFWLSNPYILAQHVIFVAKTKFCWLCILITCIKITFNVFQSTHCPRNSFIACRQNNDMQNNGRNDIFVCKMTKKRENHEKHDFLTNVNNLKKIQKWYFDTKHSNIYNHCIFRMYFNQFLSEMCQPC